MNKALPLVVGYRRVGEAVENSKPIYIIPYPLIVCMEDMGSIFMDVYPFYPLCIDISAHMFPLINNKALVAFVCGLSGEDRAI